MSDTPPLPRPPAPHLLIHTDGSCAGNLGPGGWAAVVRASDESGALSEPVILTGHAPRTTNNRMEMTAAIEALRAFPDGEATIVTDSQYLIKGITEWVRPWKSRNWKNAASAKVKNRDLWQELDALTAGRTIAWTWIKGHAGHEGNEEADRLASAAGKRAE